MAECPRCGGDTVNFIRGVCRACYMREYHQRRSAAAVTECPKCGGVSANFVHGVCRACYMRDYHQRRSAGAVTDQQRSPVTGGQTPPLTDRRRPSVTHGQGSPGTGAQRVCETPALTHDSAGPRVCVECLQPGVYARGLCLSCYMRDRRRRTLTCIDGSAGPRLCVECGGPGVYARGLCQNCYMRDRRRHRRIKLRACAVCGTSFESARRDALYCSSGCRQKAHRSGKTQAA
jgi:ribosomal protein L32